MVGGPLSTGVRTSGGRHAEAWRSAASRRRAIIMHRDALSGWDLRPLRPGAVAGPLARAGDRLPSRSSSGASSIVISRAAVVVSVRCCC